MPDFSWTQHHDLIQSKQHLQAVFQQVGFTFAPPLLGLGNQRRPRIIGTIRDPQAQLELIGPEDIVFKATYIRNLDTDEEATAQRVVDDCIFVVSALIPHWPDSTLWVATALPNLVHQPALHTRFRELAVDLRSIVARRQILLGMTWQPL